MSAAPRFDEIIHPSTRLSIVALLAAVDWLDFAFVRDRLGLSDSALSKQFATLEEAGYIAIERPLKDRRRRVRVRLTRAGRTAFDSHVAALRDHHDRGVRRAGVGTRVSPNSWWVPAITANGVDERDDAEITDLIDLSRWPAGTRVIVRREEPHPGAQLTFTDYEGRRYQVFVTDLDDPDIAYLEALHRGRGRLAA